MKAHLQVLPYTPGEDTQDALNCRSVSANEPLIIGLFCGKCPTKIKHPFLCILTTLYHIYNVQIWLEGYGVTSKKKKWSWWSTWWRRCTGWLQLQISFRKRATNYRACLWKTTYKDMASYGSLQPCSLVFNQSCRYREMSVLQCLVVS